MQSRSCCSWRKSVTWKTNCGWKWKVCLGLRCSLAPEFIFIWQPSIFLNLKWLEKYSNTCLSAVSHHKMPWCGFPKGEPLNQDNLQGFALLLQYIHIMQYHEILQFDDERHFTFAFVIDQQKICACIKKQWLNILWQSTEEESLFKSLIYRMHQNIE